MVSRVDTDRYQGIIRDFKCSQPLVLLHSTSVLHHAVAILQTAIDQIAVTYKVKHPQPIQRVCISHFCQYQVPNTQSTNT